MGRFVLFSWGLIVTTEHIVKTFKAAVRCIVTEPVSDESLDLVALKFAINLRAKSLTHFYKKDQLDQIIHDYAHECAHDLGKRQ